MDGAARVDHHRNRITADCDLCGANSAAACLKRGSAHFHVAELALKLPREDKHLEREASRQRVGLNGNVLLLREPQVKAPPCPVSFICSSTVLTLN